MARVAGTVRTAALPALITLVVAVAGALVLRTYVPALIVWLACSVCALTGVLWMAWAAAAPHR